MKGVKSKEPILCYIDGSWAYFTTQSLSKQWGDDWDDAPYEHNAEIPYTPSFFHYSDERGSVKNPRDWNEDGTPRWEILKVAWEGNFCPPCEWAVAGNSNWSVRNINKKCIPWLQRAAWKKEPEIKIWAGTTLSKFKKLIRKGGGSVYVEEK
jgi:hypothetical protein